MLNIKLSIIVPFLNSHEIVRRQIQHFHHIGLNDFKEVEVLYMDDGSDPPLIFDNHGLDRFAIHYTNDKRPWTSSLARNMGSKIAKGEWLFLIDGDYILERHSIEKALEFNGDRIGVRREFGVLDQDGNFTQDWDELVKWGLPRSRLEQKGSARLPAQTNQFIMRKQIFFDLGMYDERLILNTAYPHGEDNLLLLRWKKMVAEGKSFEQPKGTDNRPVVYMFPSGQYCGDVDTNPFGLFHDLTRKTPRNPWKGYRFSEQKGTNDA